MSKEFEEYEQACAKIRGDNATLLAEFEQWLGQKGLALKTITEHVKNADFYINTFLLYEEAITARDGAGRLSMFLGYWFPRKALWASRTSIKENAATLKKFYTFMREKGQIDADDLQELKDTIKEEMPEWFEAVQD
jgi:hypothetical protein